MPETPRSQDSRKFSHAQRKSARGHGTAHRDAAVTVSRDGGLADLLAEAASPLPRFAAVICEDIERSGRDTFNALRLERELARAGVPLFATDEPADIAGANATTCCRLQYLRTRRQRSMGDESAALIADRRRGSPSTLACW